jgi:hypothetical protein
LRLIEALRNHHGVVLLQHRRIPVRKQEVGRETCSALLDYLADRYVADTVSGHDRGFLQIGGARRPTASETELTRACLDAARRGIFEIDIKDTRYNLHGYQRA